MSRGIHCSIYIHNCWRYFWENIIFLFDLDIFENSDLYNL